MKPEAQRIKIAEACGWTDVETYLGTFIGRNPGDFNIEGTKHIPDYLNDLNAMHEAEKFVFHPYSEWGARLFECHLAKILFPTQDINEIGDCAGEIAAMVHATSSQRAEAVLKTLGLWRDYNEATN